MLSPPEIVALAPVSILEQPFRVKDGPASDRDLALQAPH